MADCLCGALQENLKDPASAYTRDADSGSVYLRISAEIKIENPKCVFCGGRKRGDPAPTCQCGSVEKWVGIRKGNLFISKKGVYLLISGGVRLAVWFCPVCGDRVPSPEIPEEDDEATGGAVTEADLVRIAKDLLAAKPEHRAIAGTFNRISLRKAARVTLRDKSGSKHEMLFVWDTGGAHDFIRGEHTMIGKAEEQLNFRAAEEISRRILDEGTSGEIGRTYKARIENATAVILENPARRAQYEIVLLNETGKHLANRYRSPSLEEEKS